MLRHVSADYLETAVSPPPLPAPPETPAAVDRTGRIHAPGPEVHAVGDEHAVDDGRVSVSELPAALELGAVRPREGKDGCEQQCHHQPLILAARASTSANASCVRWAAAVLTGFPFSTTE